MGREEEAGCRDSAASGGQISNCSGLGTEFYNKVNGGTSEVFRMWKSNDRI